MSKLSETRLVVTSLACALPGCSVVFLLFAALGVGGGDSLGPVVGCLNLLGAVTGPVSIVSGLRVVAWRPFVVLWFVPALTPYWVVLWLYLSGWDGGAA